MKQQLRWLCVIFLVFCSVFTANAQYTITGHSLMTTTMMCTPDRYFAANVSGYTSGMRVKAYWGDGDTSSNTVATDSSSFLYHAYAVTGTYTIKFVLMLGTGLLDSVSFGYTYEECRYRGIGSYVDMNSNCRYDSADYPLYPPPTFEIDSSGVPVDTMTGWFGYAARGPIGTIYTYRVIATPPGFILTCPTSGIVYDTIMGGSLDTAHTSYFGFECSTGPDFDLTLYGHLGACVNGATTYVWVQNLRCPSVASHLKITHSPKYRFRSVLTGYPYTISGNTVTIDVGSISNYGGRAFNVVWDTAGTLTPGDTVQTTYTVYPITGDVDSTNNTIYEVDTIRSSYDPNFKSASPANVVAPGQTLQYAIGFENTGNAPAHNIHIMDTLSDKVDASTLKLISSSHPVTLMQYTAGGRNIVKFEFANIELPDSSHHGLCDGLVSFSVEAKSTLVPLDAIDNRAGIYFDANLVVMTNNVENVVPLPMSVKTLNNAPVSVYPNPVSDKLTIKTDGSAYSSLSVINAMGQVLKVQQINSALTEINVKGLPSGVYYIILKGTNAVKTVKFEKL